MKTGFAELEIVTRTGPGVSATMPIKDCEALWGRGAAIGSDGGVGTVNRGTSGRRPRNRVGSGRSGRTGPQPGDLYSRSKRTNWRLPGWGTEAGRTRRG